LSSNVFIETDFASEVLQSKVTIIIPIVQWMCNLQATIVIVDLKFFLPIKPAKLGMFVLYKKMLRLCTLYLDSVIYTVSQGLTDSNTCIVSSDMISVELISVQ